mgnify:CR=1 FL=1
MVSFRQECMNSCFEKPRLDCPPGRKAVVVEEVKLSQVKRAFARWRASKASRTEPVLARLWEQAVAAPRVHGRGVVARALGLSCFYLKRHAKAKHELSFSSFM